MSDFPNPPVDDGMDGMPPAPTPATRGSRMRIAREQAGLDVAAMASRLRLSQAQVVALENDDLAALPPATFVRGFTRNYARVLNLPFNAFEDPDLTTAAPAAPAAGPLPPGRPSVLLPRPEGGMPIQSARSLSNRRWLVAAVVALVIGLIGGVLRLEHLREARELVVRNTEGPLLQLGRLLGIDAPVAVAVPPAGPVAGAEAAPPAGSPATPAAEPAATAGTGASAADAPAAGADVVAPALPDNPAKPVAGSAPAAPAAQVVAQAGQAAPAGLATRLAPDVLALADTPLHLAFDGDCWVEVREHSGRVVYSGLAHAGDEKDLPVVDTVRVVIGNAPVAHVVFNGQPVDLTPHTQDTVARLALAPSGRRP